MHTCVTFFVSPLVLLLEQPFLCHLRALKSHQNLQGHIVYPTKCANGLCVRVRMCAHAQQM